MRLAYISLIQQRYSFKLKRNKSTKENEKSDGRADTRRAEKHSSQIISNIHHIRMIRHDHGRDKETECEPNLAVKQFVINLVKQK